MTFLSGVDGRNVRAAAATRADLGLILTPFSGTAKDAPAAYRCYAADNGCFSQGARFDTARYLDWLARLPARDRCLFAVAPDVVGDAAATWERSRPVLPAIRALGLPAALVAQDGIELLSLEWSAFDCLFVGGTTTWKLSPAAWDLVAEARRRGKRTHLGRANSWVRLRAAAGAGCDSADGTLLKRERKYLHRLCGWLDRINQQPALEVTA